MADQARPTGSESLQFDRVVEDDRIGSLLRDRTAATCEMCGAAIDTEYYQINGKVFCGSCRAGVEAAIKTPPGIVPLLRAGAFGLGAGILGAIIYYGVIALLDLEIGIVAILIGYMVGYAIRKGAGGRGGRRFQVLAVALTYASIAMAYTPVVVKQAIGADKKTAQNAAAVQNGGQPRADTTTANTTQNDDTAKAPVQPRNPFVILALVLGLVAALPVLVIFGSLPASLISGGIIFFGMSQAWRMTGVPKLEILGPYRVGAASAPASA